MLTLDGLLYIQSLLVSQPLCVALFDAQGKECSFPGYSRLFLNKESWVVNEHGDLVHPPVLFALHAKELVSVQSVRIVAESTTLSDEVVEPPYTMRYAGDEIRVNVQLSLNRL